MRVRVKICGICRDEDVDCAAAHGADAIGMVMWAKSPRALEATRARRLRLRVPPLMSVVTLFVNPSVDEVRRVLDLVRPDLLQFHGEEDEAFCVQFGVPYIKAVKMYESIAVTEAMGKHASASGLLLDSFDPQRIGGTGRGFDWGLIPRQHPQPLLLAGGIDADNVGRAISEVRPYAVDVSSSVEAEPGRKDPLRVAAFMQAVAAANAAIARGSN